MAEDFLVSMAEDGRGNHSSTGFYVNTEMRHGDRSLIVPFCPMSKDVINSINILNFEPCSWMSSRHRNFGNLIWLFLSTTRLGRSCFARGCEFCVKFVPFRVFHASSLRLWAHRLLTCLRCDCCFVLSVIGASLFCQCFLVVIETRFSITVPSLWLWWVLRFVCD